MSTGKYLLINNRNMNLAEPHKAWGKDPTVWAKEPRKLGKEGEKYYSDLTRAGTQSSVLTVKDNFAR